MYRNIILYDIAIQWNLSIGTPVGTAESVLISEASTDFRGGIIHSWDPQQCPD